MFLHHYEHRQHALLPRKLFLLRMLRHGALAAVVVVFALGLGIFGYHLTEGLDWIDSLLEASMILGGMGPVHPPEATAGKLFASFYALFSGIVFLSMSAILMAPLLHRLMHSFHVEPVSGSKHAKAGTPKRKESK